MNKNLLNKLVCAVILSSASAISISSNTNFLTSTSIIIEPGRGYSTDAQALASQVCYATKPVTMSPGNAKVSLASAMSYSDLVKTLSYQVSGEGSAYVFNFSGEASYMHSVEDTDYSLSMNYSSYATNKVSVNLDGTADNGLTEVGQAIYNNGQNPYFGIACGDQIISAYQEGAMLLMALNIHFHSTDDKQRFEFHSDFGALDMFSASVEIEKIANKYGINGTISITAFQMGGDPSNLGKILGKDSNGDYYALTCSLKNMSSCVKTAGAMLDYASSQGVHSKDGFTTQYSIVDNKNLQPFDLGFADLSPVKYILYSLNIPPTLVTPAVQAARIKLAGDMKKYDYYSERFNRLYSNYPTPLTSSSLNAAKALLDRANNNIAIMSNQTSGGMKCFTQPDTCPDTVNQIEGSMTPITNNDLSAWSQFKYIYSAPKSVDSVPYAMAVAFYPTGNKNTDWGAANTSPDYKYSVSKIDSVLITPEVFKAHYVLNGGSTPLWYTFDGKSNDQGKTYTGEFTSQRHSSYIAASKRSENPYYIQAYTLQ
ncbi:hypothetical protein A0O36_01690 [Piscirickettsiaceae bacterium NZ-RLO1]|nr:hypothetical protein A0O36_01690 [Piscirickettsiaceae bacterium NZ-RLO1]